jgi:hypothetical protein
MKTELETEKTLTESLDFWKQHLHWWQASGLSQAGYCRKSGIKVHLFRYWRKKIAAKPSKKRRLVPVTPDPKKVRESRPEPTPAVVIHLEGFRIQIDSNIEAVSLRRILAVLRGL